MAKIVKSQSIEDNSDFESDFIKNKLLNKRIIFIDKDFSPETVSDWIGRILLLDFQSSDVKKPIILLINCYGGDAYAGLGLVNIIRKTKNPVYTVCIGIAASAAAIILAAGKKRFALPTSRIMFHGPVEQLAERYRTNEIITTANEMEALKEIDKKFWGEITGLTPAKLNNLLEKDNYLSPEEALKLNIIDKISWDIYNWIK